VRTSGENTPWILTYKRSDTSKAGFRFQSYFEMKTMEITTFDGDYEISLRLMSLKEELRKVKIQKDWGSPF
jgi:hypothetical protein